MERFCLVDTKEIIFMIDIPIAATECLPGRLAYVTVGQSPSSRVKRFLLLRGGVINVEVIDSKHRRSPFVHGMDLNFQLKSLLKWITRQRIRKY